MKIFKEIVVLEGKHCETESQLCFKFGFQDGCRYCREFSKRLLYKGESTFPSKCAECLAAKSALECGHHPDAELTIGTGEMKYKYCGACTMEKK